MISKRARTAHRTRAAFSPRIKQTKDLSVQKLEKPTKRRADINRSVEQADADHLVSVESESINYYDQARSRLNDTHRQAN